jgi:hypothetical protein
MNAQKIEYKLVGVIGWVTLFDVTRGDTMPKYVGSTKWAVFKVLGFGATSQANYPESNAAVALGWDFAITYTAAGGWTALQNALASTRVLPTTFAGLKFHLRVTQDGETQYYPNAVMDGYAFDAEGATVTHRFQFAAELVTATAPTT